MQQPLPAPRELILEQLERMLASDTFAGAERSRVLLRFLVEYAVENQSDRLKEYTIGSEALGRGDSFDPRTDPIVRAEASRLRNRLERYYATNGVADTVVITLPKGSYVPQFQSRAIPEAAAVATTAGARLSTAGRLQRLIWFVLGGITVGAAVTLLRGGVAPAVEPGEVGIIDIDVGAADRSLGSDFGNDLILSPDGTRIVFVARGSDHVLRLMTQRLGQRTIERLPDTDGARAPFFSPDGRWVGFWADAKMKKVSVDGGSPVELTDAVNFGGASWGEGYIIAAIDGALKRVSETSGESSPLADLTKDRVIPSWPDLLPGGSHVLFTAVGPQGPEASIIEALSLSDGKRTPLVRAGFGRYFHDGYLLYVNQGTLYAMPFDRQQVTVQGPGVTVSEDRVAYSTIFGNAQFAVSRNGTLIYRRRPASGNLVASWLDRGGGIEPLLTKPGLYTFPRLSPDGRRLAINVTDSGVPRTRIYDRQLDQIINLPFAPGSMSPVWHPKGFLVLGSRAGMSWMKTDDMSKLQALTQTANVQIPSSFTADGTRLAYAEATPSLDLLTIPVSQSAGKLTAGEPEPFLKTPYFESHPSFSPDGRWLAYGSGQYGVWDVYVRRFPLDGSQEIRVSQDGGRIGRWLSNGREFVYRTDDHRLMVVDYQVKNGSFIRGKPKEWTTVRLGDTGVISNFDVYDDRILGLVPAARDEDERIRNQVTVIRRFSDEVRRRLSPGGK
jgi:hypothetical protein